MPEGVYLDSITTEYYNGSAWVDITNYVVGDIKGNNGLGGWKPDQRVGVQGILNLTLNNKAKYFSPMGGDTVRGLSTLAGFNKGAKIRIMGVFEGRPADVIWIGRIMSIDSDDKNWGNEQTRLMAVDWMYVPSNYPMAKCYILLNHRINGGVNIILDRLSIQPEAENFDTGNFVFPAIYDNVKRNTMALSEFTKLANSELGYIYVQQDGTLRVENSMARHGWRALDQFWATPDTDSYLLTEEGGFLLLEEGGKIILDEGAYTDAAIHSDMEGHNILLPEDALLNASIIRVHPVITDTSLKVLYKLGTPVLIQPKRPFEFSAHYTDPSGLLQVSGTNMQTPVATTDYLANTAKDGSGTNKTSDVVVTATYYGDVVDYSIMNNASVPIYMTFLQARGYGIYYGNSGESTKNDTISQAAHGYSPFQFDMKYQKNTYLADMYGLSVIEEYKSPKSRITKMNYLANLNKNHMLSFLMLTIGSLILGTEDRSGISNHYYITDRAFTIKQGGAIHVDYGLKQNDSYLSGGLNPITAEFAGGTATDALNYGVIPTIGLETTSTISMWVYTDVFATTHADYLFIIQTYPRSLFLALYDLRVQFGHNFSAGAGNWQTDQNPFTAGSWNHIVITYDRASSANNPIAYINGSAVTFSEFTTPSGTPQSLEGGDLILGNSKVAGTEDYEYAFDGKIFDARVYNRILTAAEVTTLYNSGTADHTLVTDGLVFQGPAVYADQGDDASLAGTVLSSTDRLVENIIRAVGIPNGSPTLRANP